MNNLYLLNLNLKVNNIGGTTTEYENVKPIQFLQEGPVDESYSIGLLNSWNDSCSNGIHSFICRADLYQVVITQLHHNLMS